VALHRYEKKKGSANFLEVDVLPEGEVFTTYQVIKALESKSNFQVFDLPFKRPSDEEVQ
jgi:hypothetical protein